MKMRKTLYFSNIEGNIMEKDENVKFNLYMEEYIRDNLNNDYSMIFIGAPGLGVEENYLQNIIKCFEKADIIFKEIIDIENDVDKNDIESFINRNNKYIFFLMGGNPITQMQIIEKYNLNKTIKNHNDLVIGFCAGAINLSKISIITSDEDFEKSNSYIGIGRENICIEPHYNEENDDKRNKEIQDFCNQYNTIIYAIPDKSIIYFENGKMTRNGKIYEFKEKRW